MQMPVNNSLQKTFAEFFSGIGLMRIGLERQGWKIVFANDIDAQKREMYRANCPNSDSYFHLGDIHKLSISQIPSIGLATASFPCNDLSLAGGRDGLKGKNSSAFWGFMQIIKEMRSNRPRLILIENVPGFLTSRCGRDFEDAMVALNDLGYSVDPFIIDAASFVPQSRQRLFVVGSRISDSASGLIAERFYQSSVRPSALADFIFGHPNIKWNIRQLPDPPRTSLRLEDILEDIPNTAPEWWSKERSKYLLDQMSHRHREIADKMTVSRAWSYGTVFRRVRNGRSMAELRTDGLAGCLRTPRGGSGRQILFKAGRGTYHARLLTPRECARLMGVGNFKIAVPLNQALFGFGDAVCVPVIEWIAENYLNPLWNEHLARPVQARNKQGLVEYTVAF
ncbi:MAG: DNA cytosine methyltransferase [Nitrospira sp.]|nr:DNA cytosine methyltransferase [Nitrospira sp.]